MGIRETYMDLYTVLCIAESFSSDTSIAKSISVPLTCYICCRGKVCAINTKHHSMQSTNLTNILLRKNTNLENEELLFRVYLGVTFKQIHQERAILDALLVSDERRAKLLEMLDVEPHPRPFDLDQQNENHHRRRRAHQRR